MFYRSLVDADIRPMGSLKEAEAVKIVENSFRDVNIAFVNELAMSFSHLGIDVVRVIEGAASKPFAFMPHFPGCGVGGHCIPVDPYYLIKYAKQNGFDHDFLSLARKINNGMPDFTVGLLLAKLKEKGIDPVGAKVAVLGLAYKPNLDDDRESPAYEIIESMKSHGINVVAFDPYIQGADGETLENVLIGAKAAVVATAHKEFAEMLPTHFSEHGIEIIIDGRNCLNKEAFVLSGASYQGIGR
jgi:nucleotide sugar dehydrogenase